MQILYNTSIYLFFFLFLNTWEAKAQIDFTDYRPGYIITLQGDTVKGLLALQGNGKSAQGCIFKEGAGQGKITYSPAEISAYRFLEGKYYVSSTTLNHPFPEPTFVEQVFAGAVSIYYYKGGANDHYFVSKDTLFVELKRQSRAMGIAGYEDVGKVLPPPQYKGQLRYLMQDQPTLHDQIDRSTCAASDLVSLAQKYQMLSYPSQPSMHFNKNAPKDVVIKFGLSVSAGPSRLKSLPYRMYINNEEPLEFLRFRTSVIYEMGAVANIYLNFIGENRYILQVAPTVNSVRYTSHTEHAVAPFLYSFDTDISSLSLKVPLIFKYSFYRESSSVLPFLRLGSGYSLYLRQKGNIWYYSAPLSNPASTGNHYREALTTSHGSFRPVRQYLIGGAGVDFKYGKNLLSVGALYEYGGVDYPGYRSDALLQVGVQF